MRRGRFDNEGIGNAHRFSNVDADLNSSEHLMTNELSLMSFDGSILLGSTGTRLWMCSTTSSASDFFSTEYFVNHVNMSKLSEFDGEIPTTRDIDTEKEGVC